MDYGGTPGIDNRSCQRELFRTVLSVSAGLDTFWLHERAEPLRGIYPTRGMVVKQHRLTNRMCSDKSAIK